MYNLTYNGKWCGKYIDSMGGVACKITEQRGETALKERKLCILNLTIRIIN